jgi:hypothetical protein
MRKRTEIICLLLFAALLLTSCRTPEPAATAAPSPTPLAAATPEPTATPQPTPVPVTRAGVAGRHHDVRRRPARRWSGWRTAAWTFMGPAGERADWDALAAPDWKATRYTTGSMKSRSIPRSSTTKKGTAQLPSPARIREALNTLVNRMKSRIPFSEATRGLNSRR